MLRRITDQNLFVLPASAARMVYPAGAVLLVALALATFVAALPHPWLDPEDRAALTSGGKFAARIPGAVPAEAEQRVQATPGDLLPILLRPAEQAAVNWLPAETTAGGWSDVPKAKVQAALDANVRARLHMEKSRMAASDPSTQKVLASVVAGGVTKLDDGMMTQILSSARSLWSMTASAGGSVLSHILPQ